MTINNNILTHCPACNLPLTLGPIRGDFHDYTCSTHGKFSVSGTVIVMANTNPSTMENLSIKIQSAQRPEDIEMITTLNLVG